MYSATAVTAVVFIPAHHPQQARLTWTCLEHVLRRGYRLHKILHHWDEVAAALATGVQVVVFATRSPGVGEVDRARAEFVDEEATRILYQRNAAMGRHGVPQPLTESGVHRILVSDGPAPAGLDPESIEAARRLWRHFAYHGCV